MTGLLAIAILKIPSCATKVLITTTKNSISLINFPIVNAIPINVAPHFARSLMTGKFKNFKTADVKVLVTFKVLFNAGTSTVERTSAKAAIDCAPLPLKVSSINLPIALKVFAVAAFKVLTVAQKDLLSFFDSLILSAVRCNALPISVTVLRPLAAPPELPIARNRSATPLKRLIHAFKCFWPRTKKFSSLAVFLEPFSIFSDQRSKPLTIHSTNGLPAIANLPIARLKLAKALVR